MLSSASKTRNGSRLARELSNFEAGASRRGVAFAAPARHLAKAAPEDENARACELGRGGVKIARLGQRGGTKGFFKMKDRASLAHAFDPYFPAHELHQSFADGQAETGAAVLASSRTFRLAERLK